MVTQSTKITHAHTSGINGALIQAMAIKLALNIPQGKLDPMEFLKLLEEKIKPFEDPLATISEDDDMKRYN